MYCKAVQADMAHLPESNPEIRARLWQEGESIGWSQLHQRLKVCDPETARQLHPNDKQRIQRALEVFECAGQPLSSLKQGTVASEHALVNRAIMPEDRSALHERIAKRVNSMLGSGFSEEVARIAAMPGVTPDSPAMRAVGYRQWHKHLEGEYDAMQAKEAMTAATRQLAKRQLTWLRSWPNLHTLPMEGTSLLEEACSAIDAALFDAKQTTS
mgnify:CR=1 FL=1